MRTRVGNFLILTFCGMLLLGCAKKQPNDTGNGGDPPPVENPDPEYPNDFMIAVLGDTQYYVENTGTNGQYIQGFQDQIDWIKDHRVDSNIVYVIHVGDVVEHGDHGHTVTGTDPSEWIRAKDILYQLENVNGLPYGIPYGLTVGNHDTTPYGHNANVSPGSQREAKFYNQYFGKEHFAGRPYYGGSYGTANNNNHIGLFNAGGMDFVVVYIQFDQFNDNWDNLNNWAASVLSAYPKRKAIVVTHHTVNTGDATISPNRTNGKDGKEDFSEQAEVLYNKLKGYSNFFMMIGGHVAGEGRRQDTYQGRTVHAMTVNYQGCRYPAGLLRTLKFSVKNDRIEARTFLPTGAGCLFVTTEARCVGAGGSSTYSCEDSRSTFFLPWNRNSTNSRTMDFNNDGKSDPAFLVSGAWKVAGLPNISYQSAAGHIPVPGDYDADGKTDIAVYRPTEGDWAIRGKGNTTFSISGGIPVPADYDGNGVTDFAFFDPTTAIWHVKQNYQSAITVQQHGKAGDIPVPADYNGDGKVDFAVFSPATAEWSVWGGSTTKFGESGDIPVPGDYNGDGIIERATYRPGSQRWYVEGRSEGVAIGQAGDIPVPGGYNGDGKTDIAVYRPADGKIYIHGGKEISTDIRNGQPLNLPYAVYRVFFNN